MDCPRCGSANPEGKSFCGDCGELLPRRCQVCGNESRPGKKFCADCGAPLSTAGSAAGRTAEGSVPGVTATNAPERRQLTVMFCDLVGSTALSARIDPEDLREVIATYHSCVAKVVERHGGFVAKYMGDGVLIYFGYPHAHEDDAERAIWAGLAVSRAVARLQSVHDSERLKVRVGIATGLVVVGDLIGAGAAQEQAVVGETPNLAARLQTLAEPGAVLICAGTRRLVGGLFDYRDLGSVALKGIAEPVRATQVLRESAIESRFEALRLGRTPLVGREEELDVLLRRWNQVKCGEGRVVLISGEPGIGKSRLAVALQEAIAEEPHVRLRYFFSPHRTQTALHPIISQLEHAAGFERSDTNETKLAKLEAMLALSSRQVSQDAVLFAELLSIPTGERDPFAALSPQRRKELLLERLVDQVSGLAERSPVLMIQEDVHWTDATSRDLLDLAVERIRTLPVLLLITFRPEFAPPWLGQPHVTALVLSRLGPRDNAEMVARVAGGKELPAAIKEQIVARTDGVPLFAEELTKSVLESGALREEDNAYVLSGPLPALAVPTTLQASLVARLDRLAPVRSIAQIGAAIGREFSYELMRAVSKLADHELSPLLGQFAASELVQQRGSPPEALYTFKHALVQDAAYETLLKSQRARIHAQIAEAIKCKFPETSERQPDVLAHHCSEAGLFEEAIEYWLKAGHLAAGRFANVEAVLNLRKGLGLLDRIPPGAVRDRMEFELSASLGPALNATRGYGAPETLAAYERARDLLRSVQDRSRLGAIYTGLFSAHYSRGEFKKALETGKEILSWARDQDDATSLCIGHRMIACAQNSIGDFALALDHAEQALAHYDVKRHGPLAWRFNHDLGVSARCHLGISLWHSGYPERSRTIEREALESATRLNHPNTIGYGLYFAGGLSALRRRDPEAIDVAARMLCTHAKHHGLPHWAARGAWFEALSILAHGNVTGAIERFEAAMVLCGEVGNYSFRPAMLGGLAAAKLAAGQAHEALRVANEALQVAERTGERGFDADLWRVKAEAVLATGGSDVQARAESDLYTALQVAREQGSRMFELRVATRLAEFWIDQDRTTEASDLIGPVFGWFTEGFAEPDLQDAKKVIDRLGRS